MWRKLRRETKHALQFLLLPAVALLLPWRFAFPLLQRFARWRWIHREQCAAALQAASGYVPIADPADWAWRYRLSRLVDDADFWLMRSRGMARLARHFQLRDPVPQLPAAMAVFYHWGTGLWIARALHDAGHRVAVITRPFSPSSTGAWVAFWYGHARLRVLVRCGGGLPLVYPPGTLRRSVEALQRGEWIMGAPDVPPGDVPHAGAVRLLGRPARFADGVVEIARRAGVPLVPITCGVDVHSGRRALRIAAPIDPNDPQALQRIVDVWERRVLEESWAFGLWPSLHGFFDAAAADPHNGVAPPAAPPPLPGVHGAGEAGAGG